MRWLKGIVRFADFGSTVGTAGCVVGDTGGPWLGRDAISTAKPLAKPD
jgi:hypothetical protein